MSRSNHKVPGARRRRPPLLAEVRLCAGACVARGPVQLALARSDATTGRFAQCAPGQWDHCLRLDARRAARSPHRDSPVLHLWKVPNIQRCAAADRRRSGRDAAPAQA